MLYIGDDLIPLWQSKPTHLKTHLNLNFEWNTIPVVKELIVDGTVAMT